MKKIIGGLLVLTLMSHPRIFSDEIFAYKIYKSQEKLVIALVNTDQNIRVNNGEIMDSLIDSIEDNMLYITALIKEKNELMDSIHNTMKLKSKNKIKMDERQIAEFKSFSHSYALLESETNGFLKDIYCKGELKQVKNELIHSDTDFSLVYGDLHNIYESQIDAIDSLSSTISSCEELLQYL